MILDSIRCKNCKEKQGLHRAFSTYDHFCTECMLNIGGTFRIKSPTGFQKNSENMKSKEVL